jgi:hypothetical protein
VQEHERLSPTATRLLFDIDRTRATSNMNDQRECTKNVKAIDLCNIATSDAASRFHRIAMGDRFRSDSFSVASTVKSSNVRRVAVGLHHKCISRVRFQPNCSHILCVRSLELSPKLKNDDGGTRTAGCLLSCVFVYLVVVTRFSSCLLSITLDVVEAVFRDLMALVNQLEDKGSRKALLQTLRHNCVSFPTRSGASSTEI